MMRYRPESIPLMSTFQSGDPSVGIEKSDSQSRPTLRELRGTALTISWAITVLIATISWLYIIMRMAGFAVSWLLS